MQEQPVDPHALRQESDRRIAIVRENPFDSLRATISGDVADWSTNRRNAWIYGIICGWDTALDEVAEEFGWPEHEKQRLMRLRAKFQEAAQQTDSILFADKLR